VTDARTVSATVCPSTVITRTVKVCSPGVRNEVTSQLPSSP
jgi:hypothetical protein